MKDLEIWKIQTIEFKSNGLLVSNYGNVKMSSFKDRKWGDNGNGYKLVNISELGTKRRMFASKTPMHTVSFSSE